MGVHWAWGKVNLQHLKVPTCSHMQLPPLSGYGVHIVDWQELPSATVTLNTDLANPVDGRNFSFYARYRSCHSYSGQEVPCIFEAMPGKALHALKVFCRLFLECRRQFENYQRVSHRRLSHVRRQNIRGWLRLRIAELP